MSHSLGYFCRSLREQPSSVVCTTHVVVQGIISSRFMFRRKGRAPKMQQRTYRCTSRIS